jgi:hypothetical protein
MSRASTLARAGTALAGDSSGNVSVGGNLFLGTTSQAYSAKVLRSDNSDAAIQSFLIRNNSSGSASSCGYFLNSFGNSWAIEMGSTAKNSNALTFSVDAVGTPSEKMRLDTAGRLSVGTQNPTAGGFNPTVSAKSFLDQIGGGIMVEAYGNDATLNLGYDGASMFISSSYRTSAGYKPIAIYTSGVERARFDNSGNFVIGSTSAAALLHAKGQNILTANTTYRKGWIGGAGSWGSNAVEELVVGYSGIRSTYAGGDDWTLSFTAGTSAQTNAGTQGDKLRLTAGGVMTKFDSNNNTYVRDHGVFSAAASFIHIKFNLTKNTEKMLGFRLYGFLAYSAFIESYYGCYLYNAVSTPYGSIIRDAGNASNGSIYYAADGYLVISCSTNSNNYTGLRLESLVHGGDYGGGVDVQVLAYKGHSASTGAY